MVPWGRAFRPVGPAKASIPGLPVAQRAPDCQISLEGCKAIRASSNWETLRTTRYLQIQHYLEQAQSLATDAGDQVIVQLIDSIRDECYSKSGLTQMPRTHMPASEHSVTLRAYLLGPFQAFL